jgi:hypothetical protein
VVAPSVDLVAVVLEPVDGRDQGVAVGIHEGDVVQAGVALGARLGAGALERIEADVVVVVAMREEHDRDRDRPRVGGDLEAEAVAVEVGRAIEIGDAQMNVANLHGLGADGARLAIDGDHLDRDPVEDRIAGGFVDLAGGEHVRVHPGVL